MEQRNDGLFAQSTAGMGIQRVKEERARVRSCVHKQETPAVMNTQSSGCHLTYAKTRNKLRSTLCENAFPEPGKDNEVPNKYGYAHRKPTGRHATHNPGTNYGTRLHRSTYTLQ